MQKLVILLAARNRTDFAFKFLTVMVVGNLLAMAVVYSVHGYFPSGMDGQLIETTLIATPFAYTFLKVIGYPYELQGRLEHMAHTDVLTGLPNRRAFLLAIEA